MTTRIGVVADTHCPEFLHELPDRLFEVLRGVDLILHAGDVTGEETIRALESIAPVDVVRGDHDPASRGWPLSREIEVDGRRIAVLHGNRSRWIEEPQTMIWTLSLGGYKPHKRLPGALRRRFDGCDAIVFGHIHRPHIETIEGTLVFNPGAVHQWNPKTAAQRLAEHPGWFEWSWLQVARHLRDYFPPSVGILEVSRTGVIAEILPLDEPVSGRAH